MKNSINNKGLNLFNDRTDSAAHFFAFVKSFPYESSKTGTPLL